MQRQRQSNGQLLQLKLTNAGHQTHGRHGQTTSRNTEALGRRVNQAVYSTHGCLVVSERLTHTHEDNVGNTQWTSILRATFCFFQALHLLQVAGTGNDLLHNFCGGQVTGQTLLTGCTEGAVHTAASLRRDAHGYAVVIAHDDGLNERTVKEAVHNLQGVATVSLEGTDRSQKLGHRLSNHLLAILSRQVSHLGGVSDQTLKIVLGQLGRTERLVAQFLQKFAAASHIEVSDVLGRLRTARCFQGNLAGCGANVRDFNRHLGRSGRGCLAAIESFAHGASSL